MPALLLFSSPLFGLAQKIDVQAVSGAASASPAVLLIGGLNGDDESAQVVTGEFRDYQAVRPARRTFRLLAISLANPKAGKLQFPPSGAAYRDNAQSHALWRRIALEAPDLVLVVGNDFGLTGALSQNAVAGMGKIPARHVEAKPGILRSLPREVPPSEASLELKRRLSRTPRQVAAELAQVYGHDFNQLTYLPGMALIGQQRMGRILDVEGLAAPYVNGSKNPLERANSLTLAGHLVFGELAERTGDARYLQALRRAADLGFTERGEMKESMPFHDEMSDSVFMAIPILAKTGKLTGEDRYFQMAARHLAFMQKLVLRPDGLYRHSPVTDAAWGRGNAFPALGLILTLSDFPRDHPLFIDIREQFRLHMAALAPHQDEDGLWHEVIDRPDTYPEYSATAMIAFALLRGINEGWLDPDMYQPMVNKAWRAILERTGSDGVLMDVCESTNKQRSVEDYVRRAAILGRDARGGGMALMLATEMAGME